MLRGVTWMPPPPLSGRLTWITAPACTESLSAQGEFYFLYYLQDILIIYSKKIVIKIKE